MAPKRQRGSSSSPSFDSRRFVSLAASQRYEAHVVKKSLVAERGMQPVDDWTEHLIERLGWEEFLKQPEAAVTPIVREFYANAVEHKNCKAFVRGKMVPFDRTTINRYYKLQDISEDGYSQFLAGSVDYDEIIDSLTVEDTTWDRSATDVIKFPTSGMGFRGKSWHYFVSAKLMPASHLSHVTKDRAILIYCILQGKTVDVGKVINASILRTLSGHTTSGYGHPSLITALCRNAGVTWPADAELQHPLIELTSYRILRLKDGRTSSRAARTPGASSSQQPQPPAAQEQPPLHPPQEPTPSDTSVQITELATRLSYLEQNFQSHRQNFHEYTDWAATQAFYQSQCNNNLEQMMRSMMLHSGMDVTQFHQLPVYPGPPSFTAPPPFVAPDRDAEIDEQGEPADEPDEL